MVWGAVDQRQLVAWVRNDDGVTARDGPVGGGVEIVVADGHASRCAEHRPRS